MSPHIEQVTHHEMRIPKRDVTHIVLSVYSLSLSIDIRWNGSSPIRHKVNFIQLKTFELELDFAEYIQHTDVRMTDLCWPSYIPSTG